MMKQAECSRSYSGAQPSFHHSRELAYSATSLAQSVTSGLHYCGRKFGANSDSGEFGNAGGILEGGDQESWCAKRYYERRRNEK